MASKTAFIPARKNRLLLSIIAAGTATAGLTPTLSHAQGALEEIIVTAQRRVQEIQDVPISITAIGTEGLEARNIENLSDLNMLLPNVAIRGGGTTGPTSGEFVMRGVPGVSRYMDGVAQTGGAGSLSNIVELQRIEVLKGPQGTLFGKNAMGGAIHYVTQGPRDEFGARFEVTLGNFDQRRFVANVDVPLTDTLLTKITASSLEKEGFVQTGVQGVKHGDENDSVLRLQALWQPSADFSADLKISSVDRHPRYAQGDVLYDVVETQGMVINYNNQGFVFTDESDAFGKTEQYRNSSTYTGPGWRHDSEDVNLTLTWNINEFIALRSITGGRNIENFNYADLDASRWHFFEINNYSESEERSQEFQLQGTLNALEWVVGLYWADDDDTSRRYDWQFTEVAPRDTNWVTSTNRTDTAVFAEGTYEITDRLSATAGFRYTEEDFSGGQWDAVNPLPEPGTPDMNLEKGAVRSSSSASFSATTPRLSVQYDWTDDIMTYATYSEGFNSGGVNTTDLNGVFFEYDGERLKQFELGFRSDLLDDSLRLNLAYFNGIWDDIQVGEALVPGRIITQNAGEAEIDGFEIDAVWALTQSFQVNLAAGWLNTEYTELGATQNIQLGSEFALAPELTYTLGAQYEWFLTSGGSFMLRGDYGYTDDFVTIQDVRLQKRNEAYGLFGGRLIYTPAAADWRAALWGRNLTDEWYQSGGFGAFLGGVDQGVTARGREWGVTVNMEF